MSENPLKSSSAEHKGEPSQHENDKGQKYSKNWQSFFKNRSESIRFWSPIIISILVASFTYMIWNATSQGVKITEKSMKIANKAYIVLEDIKPQIINDLSGFKISITFKNTGRTPAYKVRGTCELLVTNNEDSLEVEILRNPIKIPNRASLMAPDNTYSLDPVLENIDTQTIADIKAIPPKMCIFLTGKIVYIDVFKEDRFIEWRLEYNFSDKAFGFCKKGNNAN